MDFRQLRYFIAVAEELSFSRAAKRLHISQPPLSQQVKAIEDELGMTLLARTRHRVELTEAGRLFLAEARTAIEHLGRAGDVVRRAAKGEAGEIRVAFTGSVPMFDAFPRLVQRFRERFPGARIELAHMSTGAQLQALAERRIDVGFLRPTALFCPPREITIREIWEDRLELVLPETHPLAKRPAAIAVGALAEEPFILFPRGLGCGLYDHVMALCNRAGFVPRVVQEAREGATIMGLVAAGTGISILPEAYGKTAIPGVVQRRLQAPEARSRLLIARRTVDPSPLLGRFLEIAEQFADSARGKARRKEAVGSENRRATPAALVPDAA